MAEYLLSIHDVLGLMPGITHTKITVLITMNKREAGEEGSVGKVPVITRTWRRKSEPLKPL